MSNKVSYLVRAYGETEHPEVTIVDTDVLAKDAVLSLVYGPGSTKDPDELLKIWNEDEKEGPVLDVTFEIGGVTVEKVYHVVIP